MGQAIDPAKGAITQLSKILAPIEQDNRFCVKFPEICQRHTVARYVAGVFCRVEFKVQAKTILSSQATSKHFL